MAESPLISRLRSLNEQYAAGFSGSGVPGQAATGLLLLTCMDSRIVPHEVLGLSLGDVKVVRNAGGQLNPEVEKDIVLASHLLNCHTIVIMPHRKCAMTSMSVEAVQQLLDALTTGKDFSGFQPRMIDDVEVRLRADIAALQANPLIREGIEVFGAIYDVDTGCIDWL